jgi:RIO-like serine/threonine protein kinase
MNYFNGIVQRLRREDLVVMNALYANEAINKFQAMNKMKLLQESDIKDYSIRKSIERLEALLFIEVTKTNRQYEFFLTEFGLSAISKLTEGVEV